jgi:hypothetical protein
MGTNSYKFKIILHNVLHGGHFDELSHDIIRCSVIDTARESIDKWKELGYRILVCCKEDDFDQLKNKFSDGSIRTIYILGINTIRILNSEARTPSPEANLQNLLEVSVLVDAANLIRKGANEAERQGNNGIANALDHAYRCVLKSAAESINLNI